MRSYWAGNCQLWASSCLWEESSKCMVCTWALPTPASWVTSDSLAYAAWMRRGLSQHTATSCWMRYTTVLSGECQWRPAHIGFQLDARWRCQGSRRTSCSGSLKSQGCRAKAQAFKGSTSENGSACSTSVILFTALFTFVWSSRLSLFAQKD